LHSLKELAGVSRERFDVLSLALGVDSVKSQRTLTRTAQAGNHNHLVAGDLDIDGLEVVFPGANNVDVFLGHGCL